jgi:hypothetical protein
MRSPPLTTSELVTVQRIDTFTYLAGDMAVNSEELLTLWAEDFEK